MDSAFWQENKLFWDFCCVIGKSSVAKPCDKCHCLQFFSCCCLGLFETLLLASRNCEDYFKLFTQENHDIWPKHLRLFKKCGHVDLIPSFPQRSSVPPRATTAATGLTPCPRPCHLTAKRGASSSSRSTWETLARVESDTSLWRGGETARAVLRWRMAFPTPSNVIRRSCHFPKFVWTSLYRYVLIYHVYKQYFVHCV